MTANSEQIDYWNGEGGRRWAEQNTTLESVLHHVGEAALDAATPAAGEWALDIGCGCGNQTLGLARRIGPAGRVLGVDVSAPMLAIAREQTSSTSGDHAAIEFLQADASSHAFEPGRYDLLFSRFGVMFFEDPGSAFRNLRRALKSDGRLAFCCWRALAENDFMKVPIAAALEHVPAPEPPPPDAPGPFAFADAERVRAILEEAGFQDIRIEAAERPMRLAEGLSMEESASRLLALGPVSRLLTEESEETRERVHQSVVRALLPYSDPEGVTFSGRFWLVRASA